MLLASTYLRMNRRAQRRYRLNRKSCPSTPTSSIFWRIWCAVTTARCALLGMPRQPTKLLPIVCCAFVVFAMARSYPRCCCPMLKAAI